MTVPFKMTKRRREVLHAVAMGRDHGRYFKRRQFSPPGQRAPVTLYYLNGVDVSEIIRVLRHQRLIRLGYDREAPHRQALCITMRGIEELLWPTM